MLELLIEAGMPKGVVNLVTCSRVEADSLLTQSEGQGHLLRRLDHGRQAHLRDGRHGRQARAGPDRGQEPRAGAWPTACWNAASRASSIPPTAAPASAAWPAGHLRRGVDRRRVRRTAEEVRPGAEDRPGLRCPRSQLGPMVSAGQEGIGRKGDRPRRRGRRQAGARRSPAPCPATRTATTSARRFSTT